MHILPRSIFRPAAPPEQRAPEDLLTSLVARDRLIVAGALCLVVLLAWAWLLHVGLQPRADPVAAGAMQGMAGMTMGPSPISAAYIGSAFIMWFLMMVAMMLPSAAPMILIYARFARTVQLQRAVIVSTGLFTLCYLAIWAGFSLLAATGQAVLAAWSGLSDTTLALESRKFAAVLLIIAGLYNFTSFRAACLDGCRSPLAFLTRYWRGTRAGTMRLGLLHGLYCLGCCWLLMSLLFVVGVMNLGWIAALALVMVIEKGLPPGRYIGRWVGVSAICAGIAIFSIAVAYPPV